MLENMIQVDVVESWWDYLLGCATIMLAAINLWLIYIIYKWQHKDSSVIEERQRRVNQFNNIFLIPRMDYLKVTFDSLFEISSEFEKSIDDEAKKTETNDKMENIIVELEEKFVNFIDGFDSQLFKEVQIIVERMRDGLSHDIFDTNTNEITGAAYVQKIQTRINSNYKALLKTLFSYDGNLRRISKKDSKGTCTCLYIMLGIIIILLCSLVIHNYYNVKETPEKVIFQLDSTQMKSIVNAVKSDSLQ